MDYRQKNQLEWLAIAKFIVNNKVYLVMKILLFIKNYSKKLRIGIDTRRKGKIEKAIVFAERIKKI